MLLRELLYKESIKGDVGIEIEVESANEELPLPENIRSAYWSAEHDGSLRNGMEYVFTRPQPIGKVRQALTSLNKKLAAYDLSFSFRTSVHVHVNCLELNHGQFCAYMYAYLLLEEVLMTYCGRQRKGNRFCLRLQDAEGLLDAINLVCKQFDKIAYLEEDRYRYAALNLEAARKYGSLEFRGMEGNLDADRITIWAETLINLRNYAMKMGDPRAVRDAYGNLGADEFIKQALGEHWEKFIYPRYRSAIQNNFSISLDVPYSFKEAPVRKVPEFILQPGKQLLVDAIDNLWAQARANPAPAPEEWDILDDLDPR